MSITFLTFNIRYDNPKDGSNSWSYRKAAVLQICRALDADVIGFQEVLAHQRHDLEKGLSGYRFYGRGRQADGGGEQCPLAIKTHLTVSEQGEFWLSPDPEQPGSVGWDACLTRLCTWARVQHSGASFVVFNTHFDHHGQKAPMESASLILKRWKQSRGPAVLLGDLNCEPDSRCLEHFRSEWCDCYRACHPHCGLGTYHDFGRCQVESRIDYILACPSWEIVECRRVCQEQGPFPSDHFPVFGRLKLVEAQIS